MNANAIERFRYYSGYAEHVSKSDQRLGKSTHVHVVREPVGAAALITPWNGPFASAITKVAPALLAPRESSTMNCPSNPLFSRSFMSAAR